MKIKIQ